jgi:phenylpropionate dioxygenase-like ring-hydroxylating dioxygenase large terminal subunit
MKFLFIITLFNNVFNFSNSFLLRNSYQYKRFTDKLFDSIINDDIYSEVCKSCDLYNTCSHKQNNENNKNNNEKKFYIFSNNPRLEYPNDKGQLTWYPIGFSKDYSIKPKQVIIRNIKYIVWKDGLNYYGMRDCCSHQGASFALGNTYKNTISCPYHGYVFDGTNGELVEIPKLPHIHSNNHNINSFKVVEKGDVVYFNTVPIKNEVMKAEIDENLIFVEPEYFNPEQKVVYLSENFENYAKLVSVNSLDICHIGFVHSFGNNKSPNPQTISKIIKMEDFENHYKIIYEYIAGENSLVNKIYNYNNITVENEYVLPHSTVARVKFGDLTSTIITHALPISTFKTKLFVKAYRSYWAYDLNNTYNILVPLMYLINIIGDQITQNTMLHTLKEDKSIVDNIDKSSYESMHGNFSIIYDVFSNHYKNNYKKYYEKNDFTI